MGGGRTALHHWKNTHVRVQRVNQPGVTEVELWGSYEKVTVIRRPTTEEGKP